MTGSTATVTTVVTTTVTTTVTSTVTSAVTAIAAAEKLWLILARMVRVMSLQRVGKP